MPPVKITRAEYEAKYGSAPVVATSTLDNDPIPVRITRAEYNAKYRPQELSATQNVQKDYLEMGQGVDTALEQGTLTRQRIRDRVAGGEISPAKGTFQTLGRGLQTGFQVGAEALKGFAKIALPESVEKKVKETVEGTSAEISRYTQDFYKQLQNGSKGEQEIADTIGETIELYKTDETFRNDVNAAGGFLEALSLKPSAKVTSSVTSNVADTTTSVATPVLRNAQETINNISKRVIPTNDNKVNRVSSEIADIENNYTKTRNKLDRDTNAETSRLRIAQSNVLDGAVDEDGLIRTKQKGGAIERYKNTPITDDGLTLLDVEDVVKRNLEVENKKVNLNELKANALGAVMDSGLEGGDLLAAIKRIDKDLQGLAIRADEFGDVFLSKLQDAKISTTKNIDYTKPVGTTYRKTLARVYKETIEDKSDLPVKDWNAELAKYYKDIDRLADLDGKRVKGGRLGKYTSQIVGTGIGAAGGSVGGGFGAFVGGAIGGEVAGALKGRAMAGTFSRGIDGKMPESKLLSDAQKTADIGKRDLTKPDPQVGASKALMSDPDMSQAVLALVSCV